MTKVRVAILGQGRSGWSIHANHFLSDSERFQVVAVVDPLPDRRAKAAAAFGCDSYETLEPLLVRMDVDLVVNCTPSHLHVPVTERLLRSGFDVLCDKPLARRAAEVDGLVRTARECGRRLFVFQQSRFAEYFQKVREVIDSGVLGRVVQISVAFNGYGRRWDWQCVQRFNGGNLLNTGPHPLDQALQLFGGEEMPEVFCRMDRANTSGDAEDYVKVILSGKNRPLIDLEVSSCCAFPRATYEVQGTRGGLKGTQEEIDWKYFDAKENPDRPLALAPLSEPDGSPAYCSESLVWHTGSWSAAEAAKDQFGTFGNMTASYYDMLFRHLAEDAPLLVTVDQVRRQIAVIEECHRQNPLDAWV